MTVAVVFSQLLVFASRATAADRYAVVITGASGGDVYAQKYDNWRTSLVTILKQKFRYPGDHLFVLAEAEGPGIAKATRDNVRRVLTDVKARLTSDDLLFVFLIGHGSPAGEDEAKFNLVGPDLSSTEWAALLKSVPGRLVFADTTSGSYSFLRRLAAPGRVVLTATDSAAQQFETIFPGFFIQALDDSAADLDKNGRVSVWEAFSFASTAVRRAFEQQGQLPTERALLDDVGSGVGREAQNSGPGGTLARVMYFGPEPTAAGDRDLVQRRAELERRLEDLKLRQASSADPRQYDAEIEQILVEIAKVSRQLRAKP